MQAEAQQQFARGCMIDRSVLQPRLRTWSFTLTKPQESASRKRWDEKRRGHSGGGGAACS
jgi:hypothetical protein